MNKTITKEIKDQFDKRDSLILKKRRLSNISQEEGIALLNLIYSLKIKAKIELSEGEIRNHEVIFSFLSEEEQEAVIILLLKFHIRNL